MHARKTTKIACPSGHSYAEHSRFRKSGVRWCVVCDSEKKRAARISKGMRVGARGDRTHCLQGHEYSTKNTRFAKADGHRLCIRCDLVQQGMRRQRRAGDRVLVANADKTNCPQGHPYSAQNTREGRVPSGKCRICIQCDLDRAKAKRRAGGRIVIPLGERTHCPQGHAYEGSNLRLSSQGGRQCRACDLRVHIDRDNADLPGMIWRSALTRSRRKGVPFTIEPHHVIIPAICPVLGIPLFRRTGRGPGSKDHSPTLDRTIPALGYVPGNVFVISFRANRIKSDASLDELERIASWLRATLPIRQKDTGT